MQLNLSLDHSNKKFLICSQEINGMGDLVCGLRFASLLQNAGIPNKNIIIATNNEKRMVPLNQDRFTIIPLKDASKVANVALQIFAPHSEKLKVDHLINKVPVLLFQEYGYRFSDNLVADLSSSGGIEQKSLGLSLKNQEIGILIDDTLLSWTQSQESQDPKKRIEKLKLISKHLQDAIFEGCENNEQAFINTKLLYHGYASNWVHLYHFIIAVCEINKNNDKDIIVVAPSFLPALLTDDMLRNEINQRGLKIATITMSSWKAKKREQILISENGKKLHIIYDYINQTDMKYLHMGAEKEMVVTGDQSLSEAISCGSSFVYEALDHKKNLANSLKDLYGNVVFVHRNSAIIETMVTVFEKNKQDQYHALKSVHERVYQELNCKDSVLTLVQKLLDSGKGIQLPSVFPKDKAISPYNFPFDQPMIVTAEQIGALMISYDSNRSQLPDFNDSTFEYEFRHGASDFFYQLTRRRYYNKFTMNAAK